MKKNKQKKIAKVINKAQKQVNKVLAERKFIILQSQLNAAHAKVNQLSFENGKMKEREDTFKQEIKHLAEDNKQLQLTIEELKQQKL